MEIKINFSEGKKVNVSYDNFLIRTDQKIQNGGENTNPDPFSLFIASIGACTGFYVLSFCQERKIETKNIILKLVTKKNIENKLIDEINIDIIADKTFPDKYIKSIIKVANLCTVKKHLEKPPRINISLLKN